MRDPMLAAFTMFKRNLFSFPNKVSANILVRLSNIAAKLQEPMSEDTDPNALLPFGRKATETPALNRKADMS